MSDQFFAWHKRLADDERQRAAEGKPSEADQATSEFVMAAGIAYKAIRDAATKYNMTMTGPDDNNTAPTRSPPLSTSSAAVAAAGVVVDLVGTNTTTPEAWAAATYAVNDEYQLHQQQSWWSKPGNSTYARVESEVCEDCRSTASAWVAKHVKSVFPRDMMSRGAVANVTGVTLHAVATFLLPAPANAAFHVWRSRREGRKFHRALQRLSQVKQDCMVPCPLHLPLTAAVVFQGALVTVMWLPPLVRTTPHPVEPGSQVAQALNLFRHGLQLEPEAELPVYLGADARLYVIPSPDVVIGGMAAHAVATPTESTGLCDLRPAAALLPDARAVPMPPEQREASAAASAGLVNLCAAAVSSTVLRCEASLGKASAHATAADKVVESKVVGRTLKAFGLGLYWLFPVFQSSHLKSGSSSLAVPQIVVTALVSEMVVRALGAVLVAQMRLAKVTESASLDVQHVARIVAANTFLEGGLHGSKAELKAFLEHHVMPVVRAKFAGVPTDFCFNPTNVAPAGVMRRLGEKLGLDVDLKAKQFLRFAAPVTKVVTVAAAPLLMRPLFNPVTAPTIKFMTGNNVLAVLAPDYAAQESIVADIAVAAARRVCTTCPDDHPRVLAAIAMAFVTARVAQSRPCARLTVELAEEWLRSLPQDAPWRAMALGVLMDLGDNSHIVEDAATAYIQTLKPLLQAGPEVVDPLGDVFAVERLRVAGARLATAAPSARGAAQEAFTLAKQGFRRLFRFGGFESSGVYFDMNAQDLRYKAKTAPFAEVLASGHVAQLAAAAQIGADQPQRFVTASSIFNRLAANIVAWLASDSSVRLVRLCPTEEAALHVAEQCALLTSTALRFQLDARPPGTTDDDFRRRCTLMVFTHVAILVVTRCSTITPAQHLDEVLPRLKQFIALLNEAHDSTTALETLLSNDWTMSTASFLTVTAMEQGQWLAASRVLDAFRRTLERVSDDNDSDSAAGTASVSEEHTMGMRALQRPIRILEQAHRMTSIISHHYARFVARSDTNPRAAVVEEALHRRGVVLMEHRARATLLQWKGKDWSVTARTARVAWELDVATSVLRGAEVTARLPICIAAERSRRAAIRADEEEAFEALFMHRLKLGRYGVRCEYIAAMSVEYLRLQAPFRRVIEKDEERAYLHFVASIETAARYSIFLLEQSALRALYVDLCLTTLRRTAQRLQTGRAVPAVSLYFYSEEEAVRKIIEEEYATSMQEMRLREKMFRMAVFRSQRMMSVKQPKVIDPGASPEVLAKRTAMKRQLSPLRAPPRHTDAQPITPQPTASPPSHVAPPGPLQPAPLVTSTPAAPSPPPLLQRAPVHVAPAGTGTVKKDDKAKPQAVVASPPSPPPMQQPVPVAAALDKEALFKMWKSTKAPLPRASQQHPPPRPPRQLPPM